MVKAVVVVDQAYAGWALTDEILRMATKSAPVNETFPSRLFTSQNIGSIQVTPATRRLASGSATRPTRAFSRSSGATELYSNARGRDPPPGAHRRLR